MRIRVASVCAVVFGLLIGMSDARAQSDESGLRLPALALLASQSPENALTEIDAAIASVGQDNPRILFDLFAHKARLLEELGRLGEAAQLLAELGQFASLRRELLDQDPATYFSAAADLFLRAGMPDQAREAALRLLDEQRDGGLPGQELSKTLGWLAEMSDQAGRAGKAAQYRKTAEAAREAAPDDPAARSGDDGGYRAVDVFYATDRARSGDPAPAEFYGYGRGQLELGVATVTIPDTHQAGLVETPSIWRLEFGPNPAKHVVLQNVTPVGVDEFFSNLSNRLSDPVASSLFVFVHGYNVRFDQAAKRAAQMAYDMNFPGVPVLYSWPSRGSTLGYISDTAVVRLSGRRLSRFLDDLVSRSGASSVHIVAHSMGNRALTDALELLSLRRGLGPESDPVFDQVLFAAPDVDADLFAEMLPTIRPVARRLTLYASQQDWALSASRQLHGNAPRAGQGGDDMLTDAHIDSVDMSDLGEDMLAHSYFADDNSALADIVALFWRNADPSQRCGLEPVNADAGTAPVWFYKVGECADRSLVQVMSHLQRDNVTDLNTAREIVARTVQDTAIADQLTPVVVKLLED